MLALSQRRRMLLDIQGFEGVDDETLARTQLWLRSSPGLCGLIGAVGTLMASPPILAGLGLIAAAGAVLPVHPFDLVYSVVVRRITGGEPLPPNGAPRRFACAVGSVWLALTAWLFASGYGAPAFVLGAAFVAVAALVAATHVCLPSITFRFVRGELPAMLRRRVLTDARD